MQTQDIALIITDLAVGGAERCVVELATRVDRGRFRPVVYSLAAAPPAGEDECLKALEAAGIVVHFLGAGRIWQFPAVVGRLERLLRGQGPQVAQTFLFHANIAGRIAARRAGVPRVVSGIRVAQRRPRWRLWLDRGTDRLVDRHICVSRAVAEFAARQGRLPAEKLAVIPNGVDLARFRARGGARGTVPGLGIVPAGREAIACIGRLDRQKGLGWLLETAAVWMPQLPGWDLLLVGRGPQRARLEAQCRRLGLRGRVHFLGWRPDVAEILAASRLLVLTSAWEGMPNAVLEAMAAGLPVVATDVEGVRELLGPAATTQVVQFGDTEALAQRLISFASDAEMAAQTGAENHRRAETNFSLSGMVAAYEDLWNAVAAGR
jgi:glycosyltransferase involved in cell wall biosynthesis